MRQLFLVLAIIFTGLSIVFASLPLGTLALIPIGIAIVFGFLTLKKSDLKQQKVVKVILFFAILSLVFVVGKEIFTKDEVEVDKQFDTKKTESKKEAKKDLEDLDGL